MTFIWWSRQKNGNLNKLKRLNCTYFPDNLSNYIDPLYIDKIPKTSMKTIGSSSSWTINNFIEIQILSQINIKWFLEFFS